MSNLPNVSQLESESRSEFVFLVLLCLPPALLLPFTCCHKAVAGPDIHRILIVYLMLQQQPERDPYYVLNKTSAFSICTMLLRPHDLPRGRVRSPFPPPLGLELVLGEREHRMLAHP